MSDKVVIRGLRVFGHHGVTEAERRDGQTLVIDVECKVDASVPGRSDDLADTVDYGLLSKRIADFVAGESLHLLEALAERIAEIVLSDALVKQVKVSVAKPSPPLAEELEFVQVQIKRGR